MSRAGIPNRNFPGLSLKDTLVIAAGVQEHASGKPMSRLLLADAIGSTPSSSTFKAQLSASRAYGLTSGTEKAERVELSPIGDVATSGDPAAQRDALRRAAVAPDPFGAFYREYSGRKVPSAPVMRRWLEENADVAPAHSQLAVDLIIANGRFVGLLRSIKGADYVFLDEDGGASNLVIDDARDEDEEGDRDSEGAGLAPPISSRQDEAAGSPARPGRVFIGHGKNRKPVEQLKAMLGMLGVEVAVAIDEAHSGRPVSLKVAEAMKGCTSACFIFTADERYTTEDGAEHARPSDNAVYELGAASVLYGKRIVIFKETGVTFASDFSDLGYISFEKDQLEAKMGDLLKELVSFGILEIRAATAN